MPLSHS